MKLEDLLIEIQDYLNGIDGIDEKVDAINKIRRSI